MSRDNIIDGGDVLIIGAGLAGLFTALKLDGHHTTILCAETRQSGAASYWAQGGIAAARAAHDSPAAHARDTIAAGDGLVVPHIAHLLATEAAARIEDLLQFGVAFDRAGDDFHLGREAAHSHSRILGVGGDRSGAAIMQVLAARAATQPHIGFMEGLTAYELAVEQDRVIGVFARKTNAPNTAAPLLIKARAVVLASGGCGHLYQVTTNPSHAIGAALAMAARAGARLDGLEFVQFHPTALANMGAPAPLATEALRGRGAYLINGAGRRFMPDYHPDAELAPRDNVARAVHAEIAASGEAALDLRHIDDGDFAANLDQHFPTIAASCRKAGLDPTTTPLPIAPAAHYHMGGICVTAQGRADVQGLWVCGEAAASGAHGANRLASNSLLEALVFGARVAEDIGGTHAPHPRPQAPTPPPAQAAPPAPQLFASLRATMSAHVGVVRDADGLARALEQLTRLENAIGAATPLANAVTAALLITAAAYQRQESRGAHYRRDYPQRAAMARRGEITLAQAHAIARESHTTPIAARSA